MYIYTNCHILFICILNDFWKKIKTNEPIHNLKYKPLIRKRHKLGNFVGLMGKRSSAADSSSEWKTVQDLVQRR
ncbi:hypothetical protein chiPu_0001393 [Chiloscyllium punctatum]|uniref:Tachykinin precursor 1 n=1 Tax=Chiloscyllium punctatum TaxID=137246 RepID=A0A401RXY7_CHIPU|nr:hypothetical protein [Chiloscyllium punctatum]